MDKDFLQGIKIGLGFVFLLSFVGLVSAVGFHYAEEVLPGNFEGNYFFDGNLNVSNDLIVDGVVIVSPKSSYTCDSDTEGGIFYDSDDNNFYGCDGSNWGKLSTTYS